MSMEAICDGCGKRAPAESGHSGWFKPSHWFERTPKGERTITACSRDCIEIVEQRRKDEGKDSNPVVLPL